MTDASTCPTLRDGDDEVARLWTAGSLAPEAANDFEAHLLTCNRCQRAVEHAAGITAALRSAAAGHVVRRPAGRWQRWAIPVAVAAGLATLALWPRDPLARLANPGPAPAFAPAAVRAETDAASESDLGMAAYQRRDYAQAATHLSAGTVGRDATPGLQFFLGVSRLLSDNPRGAVAALATAASSDNPYAPDAQLWLAKAWLRLGAPDSATAALSVLARRSDSPQLSAHARALADSIREVRRR